MYGHPKHLLDETAARAAMLAFDRLALLITHGAEGLHATHLPLVIEENRLIGHIARGNGQWRDAPCEALIVMPGAETYVSPNWYETKKQTGRAVPTWNYETLFVRGRLTIYEDPALLRANVEALSVKHEAGQPAPWKISDAPEDYLARLIAGIVGVELAITSIEGKKKLSQDKSDADFDGVAEALSASADPRDRAAAEAMKRAR